MTWFKDGSSLTNDPPHVRIRTSTDGTAAISTLTVDNFNFTDNGDYFCQASDDTNSESSTTLNLTSKLFTQYSTVYLIISMQISHITFACVRYRASATNMAMARAMARGINHLFTLLF